MRSNPRKGIFREYPEFPKFNRPLSFGDPEQIAALKKFANDVENTKEEIALCASCDGEGMITCPDCNGTGGY